METRNQGKTFSYGTIRETDYRMNRNAGTIEHANPAQRHQQPYYLTHDFSGPADLTTTLVHAISDVTGVDVRHAEEALYEHVDPDALDALFKPTADGNPRTSGQFTFSIWGHQLTISGTGQIAIVSQSVQSYQPA